MEPEAPRRPWWDRLGVSVVSSKPGASVLSRVMHRIDRPLLRLTRGRLSFAAGYPVLLLTTTGAKSGKPRTLPLLYVEWEDGIAVIASRFGKTRHPGWYHNLRAHPQATVEIKGERRTYTARQAEGDEREEIWSQAANMYSGYEKYAGRAGRKIPVMILTPAEEPT